MTPFKINTIYSAPEDAKKVLKATFDEFGMIPNLEGVMSTSPALLKTYSFGWSEFQNISLTSIEQQIVYQSANFENNCEYCVPWHTLLSEKAGMSVEDIDSLRNGTKLSNEKHEALRVFTTNLIRTRGSITPGDLKAFIDAGYTEQNALEVILGIAIKTMSNYTNAIAQTPLDVVIQSKSWSKPNLRKANLTS